MVELDDPRGEVAFSVRIRSGKGSRPSRGKSAAENQADAHALVRMSIAVQELSVWQVCARVVFSAVPLGEVFGFNARLQAV